MAQQRHVLAKHRICSYYKYNGASETEQLLVPYIVWFYVQQYNIIMRVAFQGYHHVRHSFHCSSGCTTNPIVLILDINTTVVVDLQLCVQI